MKLQQRVMWLGMALALLAFSLPAWAQTCDLEGSVTVLFDGKPDSKATFLANGIPRSEVDKQHSRAMRVVDEASKQQDRGGKFQIEFDETRVCDGTRSKGQGVAGVMVQGVTLHGMNKIARSAERQLSLTITDEEKRAAKGKKRSLGRD